MSKKIGKRNADGYTWSSFFSLSPLPRKETEKSRERAESKKKEEKKKSNEEKLRDEEETKK